LLIHGVE
jgi:hypothetical protein